MHKNWMIILLHQLIKPQNRHSLLAWYSLQESKCFLIHFNPLTSKQCLFWGKGSRWIHLKIFIPFWAVKNREKEREKLPCTLTIWKESTEEEGLWTQFTSASGKKNYHFKVSFQYKTGGIILLIYIVEHTPDT